MSESRGLTGHLELVCDVDARGLSRLRRQSFRAPFHLSKPHWENGTLVLNVVNPTSGYLEGDRLHSDILVERGARLLLTTPGASRVHTMRGGQVEVNQRFRVEAGGSMDVWPEWLIPQRGARYWQHTDVEVEEGGELLFFEMLAPGRVAAGEVFVFDELRWTTNVRLGGRLIARERYRLTPGDGSLGALQRIFPTTYYASAFLISPVFVADPTCLNGLLVANDEAVWLGVSRLGAGGIALKIIAADSLVFRRILHVVREVIYAALGRPSPGLRRTGSGQHT